MPSYLVVGSSRGIGLEFVRQLAQNADNTVFATARNKQTATHLNAFIGAHPHGNVHVLEVDIADFRTLRNAAADAAKITNGTLDVLIHNAARLDGQNVLRTLLDYPSEEELHNEFMEAFEVNTLGGIHAVNAFLPLLRSGTNKKIIFMGGDAIRHDFIFKTQFTEMSCLSITKFGQKMTALKYAVQLKDEGFTVVTVSPGWVDTSATNVSAGARE
ncbi:NAD(P)-binding protein [Daedalea quercina L-15889]|uniref:NAD(P)-binding protein n=1 Tax=Daedalea quercina L-15889 TaxID=1314783 RepID=A0A165MMW9_9APHY|nr:NAD(P)-binding protein [Daedalea quercina L-15889]